MQIYANEDANEGGRGLLLGLHQLLGDVVEEVPAPVGEGALQERQRHPARLGGLQPGEGQRGLQPARVACGGR